MMGMLTQRFNLSPSICGLGIFWGFEILGIFEFEKNFN
jgi:hypothetical protein